MCVKILYADHEVSYDMNKPLEDQLVDSAEIVVGYDPEDPAIGKFFTEMERVCQTGVSCDVNIKVVHNNHLSGARANRQAKKLNVELEVNNLIKAMVLSHSEVDRKLKNLTKICSGENE